MPARKAEVVYVGDAASLIRASEQAKAAAKGASTEIAKTHGVIETSATRAAASLQKLGRDAAIAFAGAAAASVAMAMKAEKSAAQIAAASGVSTEAAKAIEDRFLATAGSAEWSGQKIGAAYATVAGELKTVEGHALSSSQAMKVMDAAMDLAEATGGELTTTTETLGKVMLTYGLHTSEAAKTSDILFNASRATGTSVEEVASTVEKARGRLGALAPSLQDTAGLMLDLAEHGIKGRQALAVLNGEFGTLLGGGKATNAMVKELGLRIFDSTGKFVGMHSVLTQLQPKLAKLTQESQLQATKALFGASANKQLLGIILQGPEAFDAATKAVSKHGAAHRAAEKNADTLHGELEKLKAAVEDLGGQFGEELTPEIKGAAHALEDGAHWLRKHETASKALAGVIATALGGALTVFAYTKAVAFVGATKDMIGGMATLAKKVALRSAEVDASFAGQAVAAQEAAAGVATAEGEMVTASRAAAASMDAALMTTGIGVTVVALGVAAVELKEHWSEVMESLEGAAEKAANAIISALNKAKEAVEGTASGGLIPLLKAIGVIHGPVIPNIAGIRGQGHDSGKSGMPELQGPSGNVFGLKGTDISVIAAAAAKYHINPNVLMGVYGTETSYGKDVSTSSAGAKGAFQFIEETARKYGYPYTNHETPKTFRKQAEAAARYLADLIKAKGSVSKALEAYSGQTPGYAKMVAGKGTLPSMEELLKKPKKGTGPSQAAIDQWAERAVGKFAESWGKNTGPELDKLQSEFHTHAASWCSEFATTAAMMGGANKAVRTASVATIREWAEQGSHGYKKGISHDPHVGSLMMFGDSHVAFVQSVNKKAGTVEAIEGNANGSGGVVRRTRKISEGDYATPIYHKLTTGKVALERASKAYEEAAKKAEHLFLTAGEKAGIATLSAGARSLHGMVESNKNQAADNTTTMGLLSARWAATPQDLTTAAGVSNQTQRDELIIRNDKARKKFYERELKALQKEATYWAKLRDSYRKFARHAHDKGKTEALDKAAGYQARIDQAKGEAKELKGTIYTTETEITEAETTLGGVPVEAAAAQAQAAADAKQRTEEGFSNDYNVYQEVNSKIDLEERAGILTPEQAKAAKKANAQKALAGGFGAFSETDTLRARGDLKEFSEATQDASSAAAGLAEALKTAQTTLNEFTNAAKGITQVELNSITKSLADIISGQIAGVNYHGRQLTPGAGTAARY